MQIGGFAREAGLESGVNDSACSLMFVV